MKILLPEEAFTDAFKLIPAGVYDATLNDIEERVSSRGDSQNLFWHFAILTGDCKDSQADLCTNLSTKALWKLVAIAAKLGMSKEVLQKQGSIDPMKFIGKSCKIIIENYTDNKGNQRSRIKDLL